MKPLVKILIAISAFSLAGQSHAGTHTWSGAGANTNWSTAANWSSGGVPSAAEAAPVVLIFPNTATNFTTTPNIPNLNVDSIQITSSSNSTYLFADGGVNVNLTGAGVVDMAVNAASRGATWKAPIRLAATCLIEHEGGTPLDFQGVVSGPGGLTKKGGGIMRFSTGAAANTFTGTLHTEGGGLELGKIAGTPCFGGNLEISGNLCHIRQSNQIPNGAHILIDGGGLYTYADTGVSSVTESIGSVTLRKNGQIMVTASNRINLGGTITRDEESVNGSSSIRTNSPTAQLTLDGGTRIFNVTTGTLILGGNLSDGGAAAGITKTGDGILEIETATSFTGPVVVQAGTLVAEHNQALGSTVAGTTISANGTLKVGTDTPVTLPAGEALSVSGTVSHNQNSEIAGPITLSGSPRFSSTASTRLTLSGVLSGFPSVVYFSGTGGGTFRLSGAGANTFDSHVTVEGSCTLELAKTNATAIPSALVMNGGKTRLLASNQIADNSSLYWTGPAEFDANSFSETVSYAFGDAAASIRLGDGTLTVTGSSDVKLGSAANKATIHGSSLAKLRKMGTKTWTIWAAPAPIVENRNTVLSIESGILDLRGDWPGEIQCLGGSLLGSANVGVIKGLGGALSLSDFKSAGFTGQSPGSVNVKMDGNTPGTGFDRMISSGPINLAGQTLFLSIPSFVPTTSAGYRIIVNNGADPIQGTFVGRPEGSLITINGYPFTLTYKGGDGNDVELIFRGQGTPGPEIVKVTPNGNGTTSVYLKSPVGTAVNLFSNPKLEGQWASLGAQAVDAGGLKTVIASTPGNPPSYFFRLGFLSF